jgi:hypothetical protein
MKHLPTKFLLTIVVDEQKNLAFTFRAATPFQSISVGDIVHLPEAAKEDDRFCLNKNQCLVAERIEHSIRGIRAEENVHDKRIYVSIRSRLLSRVR